MEGLQAISRPGSQTVHHRSALLYDLVISSFSDATSYGSTSPPIRPPNGSPTRSPRPSLGSGTPIPHPGPRRFVRPCRNATSRCHGHSRPTNRAAIALAEWTRRTTHRLDPARVPGPCRGPGRRAPTPDPGRVCQLLQRTQDPPNGARQSTGMVRFAIRTAVRELQGCHLPEVPFRRLPRCEPSCRLCRGA